MPPKLNIFQKGRFSVFSMFFSNYVRLEVNKIPPPSFHRRKYMISLFNRHSDMRGQKYNVFDAVSEFAKNRDEKCYHNNDFNVQA